MTAEKLKGEVVYLYAFDVADEIRTERIGKILSKKATPLGIQLDHTLPKTLPFYRPLTIDLKRGGWKFKGTNLQPVVRVYDVGVVSIMIAAPFETDKIGELFVFHQPVLDNQRSLDKAAYELCAEVVKNLREFLVRGMPKVDIPEAYTVFCLREIDAAQDLPAWIQEKRREIAGLLEETDPASLADQQIEETFRHFISFSTRDATIIGWDAALVVDLSGPPDDVVHALELANLQLEELVLMDKRLDRYMDDAYDDLERKRNPLLGLPRRELGKLRRFLVDVAKITDEVSNISKFFGDWYVARIYLAARERFKLSTWHESIVSRLNSLDNLYEVLREEASDARMLLLELLIVLLFIFDLIAVFWIKN
jgi:hypothetical protein